MVILFRTEKGVVAERHLAAKLSNGDPNEVLIKVTNYYTFRLKAEIIDEIPVEFQVRDFRHSMVLKAQDISYFPYTLRPTFRGMVHFGHVQVMVSSPLGLVKRRFTTGTSSDVPVYPSLIQMKNFDLSAISQKLTTYGIKKVRSLGHTMEFEKIKEYVPGDDFRTVNWKATAKSNKLMVNQFQDEKSQSVYCIIDKGRVMKMPFKGLSLLDYAINTSLVVSNIVIRRHDFAGFFSFSKKIDNWVAPDKKASQMMRIMDALYNVRTDFFESDYGRLYAEIKRNIRHRSLLLLFTNFETIEALNRQKLYLQAIAKNHLLIVILFHNTELDTLINQPAGDVREIYDKIIAEKFVFEKKLIVQELKSIGIQSILTKPEHLTIETINKYLEVKARGIL
jgi:uncharacterized protein (DUF58 family)